MQFKQKLAYIALGGLLVFMGQLLPGLIAGGSATAQDEKVSGEFDQVTCRSLKIVDNQGKTYALLEKQGSGWTSNVIQVFNHSGKTVCNITETPSGGYISVHSSNTSASASMGIDQSNGDGRVRVTNRDGNLQAWMMVDEFGGRVTAP